MSKPDERARGILAAISLYAAAAMSEDGMVSTTVIRDTRDRLTSIGEDAMIRFLVGVVQVTLPAIEGPAGADEVMAGILDNLTASAS